MTRHQEFFDRPVREDDGMETLSRIPAPVILAKAGINPEFFRSNYGHPKRPILC
jgi:hypothetical protein